MLSGWWAVALAGAVVFGWAAYLEMRRGWEDRLAAWWVARAREWGGATGVCSLVVSGGALGCYGLVAFLGTLLASHLSDPRWALLITGPAMLAYAPFVLATAPLGSTGYMSWRSTLESAGADARHQRLIAWSAGPPSLMGTLLVIYTLWTAFVA